MSVAYEPRNFIHDGSYPPLGDTHDMTDLQGVHDVHEVHEVDEVHQSHNVHEPHDVHDHHEVHETHDLPDVHDVHAVHELQAAQGVTDVTDVPDVHDAHELHDPHNAHEVQHEVHDVHDVHELQTDDGTQFDDTDVVTELVAAVNGYHDHAPAPLIDEPEERMVLVHGLPDVCEPQQMSSEMVMKDAESPQPTGAPRMKAIPKPARQATKNLTGKFVCTWPNCNEEIREFSRKCEWNKHMDKHDRPYKCTAEGCEKLPGFTYSGGLLRHEREVHAKHGGPKNPLNCPHPTCKRHTGKGFSRQENLNEHLRRCHRNGSPSNAEGDTDDAASETGVKRKRETEDDVAELRAEVKKQRLENEELRQKLDTQTQQIAAMMQQITDLQARDLMQ